jgi:signal transduction histidine kinase
MTKPKRTRLLVVDDQPINIQTLNQIFQADHEMFMAMSGQQALDFCRNHVQPDLILLDVVMPEMDGLEVCRRLKDNPATARIPVVFVTARGEIEAESAGLALGAVDYLVKPINPMLARQRIRNLLERERLRKEVEAQRDHLEEMVQARTAALSIAKEAAEAANRAKTTFLANMSHELRTPLNGIMGFTALVKRRQTDPKLLDQLGKVEKASQHLLSIINDILDISRIEAERLMLDRIPFRPADVLEKITHLILPQAAAKGLELVVQSDPALAGMTLLGDPLRLEQVLLNLLGNAVKFTGSGTLAINISIGRDTADTTVLRFEVRDTGIGISAADQKRIFRPFEQVDSSMTRSYGGTGLGLPISRRLVQLMDGEIGVNSTPGQGSTFWFLVAFAKTAPLLPAAAEPELLRAETTIKTLHNGKRVLLAEDEPINQEVLRALLEEAGLTVDLAENGVVATERARDNDYALILMDVQMPQMGGVEATRVIRQLPQRALTPILAMTASAFDEDRQLCLDIGMNDFITKPIDAERLFQTMLKWLPS